jgi:hypothetical protein
MIEPFSRKPTNAREWQLRAQVLQKQLEGLSIEELLRGARIEDAPKVGDSDRSYDPDQPRVPAGHQDGGQWTSKGGHNAGSRDPTIRSDATPSNEWQVGARYASGRGPRVGPPTPATQAQLFRLGAARTEALNAIRRVQEIEPNWRPQPSAYQTVEGMIRAYQAEAQQASQRYVELTYLTGPGRFAAEWLPAPPPGQRLTSADQRRIDQLGAMHGGHICGTFNPGTRRGRFVGDHQIPTALGRPWRIFPQCLHCSNVQGGKVRALMNKKGR